ncbi:MAG: hypothetical protein HY825_16790 [Acidobacteria bacterium]|nr:hypothetical protein [Acidobacteriota bacterium]
MHRRLFVLAVALGFVLACVACSKKKDEAGAGGGGGGAPGAGAGGGGGGGAAAGADFEDQAMEFKYSQFADNRNMVFKVKARIPKGWKLMTEGTSLEMMHTFMPPDAGAGASLFNSSSVTVSPSCNGQCLAAKLPEQIAALAKQRLEMQGEKAKLLKDEEARPGVRVFVVEYPGMKEGEKSYNVGVTHMLPGQDSAMACEAMLQGAQASMWQAVLDACLAMEIATVDPLVGEERAKQEEANLAKCPQATTVKFTPKEAKPEEPTFASVQATLAETSSPASLSIYLSSAPMANREEFRDKELQPGEGVVTFSLYYTGGDSDVLSGKYLVQGDVPTIVSPGVRITGGTTLQFVGNPESFVEIVARTPNKVCGRFDIHDEWHQMTGEFVVDITPSR